LSDVNAAVPEDASFADIRAALADEGVQIDEATPAATAPAVAKTDPAPEPESDDKDEPEAELPKGVQKRIQKEIDKAVKARADAERFRAELAAQVRATAPVKEPATPAEAPGKPIAENFPDYEQYIEALTDWKLETREAERAKAELKSRNEAVAKASLEAWQAKAEAVKAEHPDYDSAIADAAIPITPAMHEAIFGSDLGPQLAYHLAKNPEECKRLAALTPVAAVRALGRLEASLAADTAVPQTQKPAPKTAAPLPKPPAVLGGSAAPSVDLDKCSMAVFKREFSKVTRPA
jgi:hypothetical protein